MFENFLNTWRPDNYHGINKKAGFFEGWYYKITSKDLKNILAIIPGISLLNKNEQPHSFVLFYNDKDLFFNYFLYSVKDFYFSKKDFKINIKNSFFSKEKIILDLDDGNTVIKGELKFSNINGWPVTFFSPGIMGWYGLIPFMECYYHVLSFKHKIEGILVINGEEIDFTNGNGYIEKNWGKSFPSAWIWLQGNHFEDKDVSFIFSIAKIPFLHFKFSGIAGGVKIKDKLYKFTTYNGAKIKNMAFTNNSLELNIISDKNEIEILVLKNQAFNLPYPTKRGMVGRIYESLNSNIIIRVKERGSQEVLFEGESSACGVEISENAKDLFKNSTIKE